MDKTPMQTRIEFSVTGGPGYDSQTDFSKTNSIYSDGLDDEDVKNTAAGLQAHLRKLTGPEIKTHGRNIGEIFSYSGRRMKVFAMPNFRFYRMDVENQKMVDKAYSAEAKARGRIKTLFNGIADKVLGKYFTVITEQTMSDSFN